MKFSEFSLHEDLLKGIESSGYVDCTPVQEQVLQNSLEGRDLYVQSQTGTGKTAAYLVSIVQELLSRAEVAGKKALIMVPTRELAVQVQEEAEKLVQFTSLKCASFFGGVGYDKQILFRALAYAPREALGPLLHYVYHVSPDLFEFGDEISDLDLLSRRVVYYEPVDSVDLFIAYDAEQMTVGRIIRVSGAGELTFFDPYGAYDGHVL